MSAQALSEATMSSNFVNLAVFPIEVLSGVVALLDGRNIALLWACGSTRLNKNLTARGVATKFDLTLDPLFRSKWPSIINKLPFLSDFYFHDHHQAKGSVRLEDLQFEAPLSPRTLRLEFEDSLRAFLKALKRSPSIFSTLSTLIIEGEQAELDTEGALALKSLSSLSTMDFSISSYSGSLLDFIPPNLTFLDMGIEYVADVPLKLPSSLLTFVCWIGDCDNFGDVRDLPPSLTKFCFYSEFKDFSLEEISQLPTGLTSLTIKANFLSEEYIKVLPPSLRTLKSCYDDETPQDHQLKLFPRNLTKINSHPTITVENVEFLPPGLITLKLVSHDPALYPKLSPNLKSLQCLVGGDNIPYNSLDRLILPKFLTSLTYFKAAQPSQCLLPETLKTFYFNGTTFTAEDTRSLPKGLEILTIPQCDPEAMRGLPQGLKLLRAGTYKSDRPTLITAELAAQLPRTLISLEMVSMELESPQVIYNLPDGLDNLSLEIKFLDKSCNLSRAPSSLRTLSIYTKTYESGLAHSLITTLPRKILSFTTRIGGYAKLSDIGVEALQRLPPGLTSLNLPESDEIEKIISSPLPGYLPPLLKRFVCGNKKLWTPVVARAD